MADTKTIFSLGLKDNASAGLRKFKGEFKQTIGEIESDGGGLGDMLGGALPMLGKAAAGLGIAWGANEIANMTFELGRAGSESMRVRASFDDLAAGVGSSAAEMLQAMRTATAGTVADSDLMLSANRAIMLGVADNADEMAQLMAAAIERGRALGVGAQQAVNDVITGIGRMSPQILDNLGIVGVAGAFDTYAASLGKTAQQLTDVEKKQALVNAVLATASPGGQVINDAASAFERMDAAIKNAQSALGELFSPAVAVIAQTLADTVNGALNPDTSDMSNSATLLGGYFALMGQGITDIAGTIGDVGNQFNLTFNQAALSSEQLSAEIATLQERLAAMKAINAEQALAGQAQAAQASQVAIDQLNERIATLQRSLYAQNAATHDSIYGVQMLAGATRTAAGDVNTLAGAVLNLDVALRNMAPVLGNLQGIRQGAIGRAESLAMQAVQLGADPAQVASMLGQTTDAIWNMGLAFDATTEAQFLNKVAAEGQLTGLEGLVGGLTAAQQAASKLASGGLSEANKALNDLRSSVSGLVSSQLQNAFSLSDISWPGMDGGGDRTNENARRLAAIANEGLIGQDWLGQFAQEAPATYADLMLKIAGGMDAQGAAQMLLSQFQSGLRPDLINFDLIKQRVKDELTSQAAIQAMTADLTSQLMAEMGVTAEQVQGALGALGLGTGGAADAGAMKQEFLAGLDASGIATGSVAAIATAFKSNESSLRSSGGVVGAWWGEGFMTTVGDNVPGQLLDMLTTKLMPYIWAQLATAQSTTGPEE